MFKLSPIQIIFHSMRMWFEAPVSGSRGKDNLRARIQTHYYSHMYYLTQLLIFSITKIGQSISSTVIFPASVKSKVGGQLSSMSSTSLSSFGNLKMLAISIIAMTGYPSERPIIQANNSIRLTTTSPYRRGQLLLQFMGNSLIWRINQESF